MTLDMLLFGDALAGDDLAVCASDVRTTVASLRARADVVAGALREAGAGPGSGVVVMLPNGPDLVATLFGVWRAGGVYVPLNPRLTGPELVHVLRLRAAGGPGHHLGAAPARDRPPDRRARRRGGPDRGAAGLLGRRREAHGLRPGCRARAVHLGHDRTTRSRCCSATTACSSCSTASSARCAAPAAPARRARRRCRTWSRSRSRCGPASTRCCSRSASGAPVVVMEQLRTGSRSRRWCGEFGIRSTVLPPAAMTMLADDPTSPTSRRCATCAASPRRCRRCRPAASATGSAIAMLNGYGQTEIGGEIVGWSAADSKEFGDDKLGSVGRPHRGVSTPGRRRRWRDVAGR